MAATEGIQTMVAAIMPDGEMAPIPEEPGVYKIPIGATQIVGGGGHSRDIENYWECDNDCGDIDCEGCKMRRQINSVQSGNEIIDYYFPHRDWVEIHTRFTDRSGGYLNAASCVRCGCLVMRDQWSNHVQFHTNSVR